MTKYKIRYNDIGCIYCNGQIMSICFGRIRISSKCIKCGKDIPKYAIGSRPRSTCKEEFLGRIMAAYKGHEI